MTARRHGLADRYLIGWRGIEIGGSTQNSFNLPDCRNVDWTDDLTTRFKEEERSYGCEPMPVDIVAEGDSLPLGDNSQDYVISSHVIEHFPDPIKAIKEWVRVVHPGGLLFLIIPLPDSHPADKGREVTTLDHLADDHERGQTIDTHEVPEGHEKRGHYHVFSYASFKAFIARFFPDSLEWIDGEPKDQKVGNGHCHVLRVVKSEPNDSPRIDVVPTRKRIWVSIPDDTGCTFYRQGLPYEHCIDDLSARGIDIMTGGTLGTEPADSSFDAYVMQRTSACIGIPTLAYFVKKSGRRLIWDLDDDFAAIPEWSPAYKNVTKDGSLPALGMYLDLADVITVTNDHLASRITEEWDFTTGKVRVLPNLIDASRYTVKRQQGRRRPRVMWTGSAFHSADLKLLVPVVERMIAEGDWEFVFVGDMPQELRYQSPDRCWQAVGAQIRYYPQLLCDIAPDVALAIVEGCRFDASKSAIKWMECTLAGAAVVATDFGPYRAAIEHDRTGILVQNTTDAWVTGIEKAFVHRRRLQAAAQDEVLAKHSWQSPEQKAKWVDFFTDMVQPVTAGSA